MSRLRILPQLLVIGTMAVLPAGCGIIPNLAQQTTAAALAPFTTAAQVAGYDMQILSRSVSAMTAQTAVNTRQITSSLNNSAYTTQAAASRLQPNPVSYQMAPTARTPSYSTKPDKTAQKNKGANLNVLPDEVLVRLTKDQAGLQSAAQSEAMKSPVGETIFWHQDGREGTAVAETENRMGGFTCRTFVQTIALEDYFDKASVTACRTDSGAWTRSF